MAAEVEWDVELPTYQDDDVQCAGIRVPTYRGQAFPPEMLARFRWELEDSRTTDLLHRRVTDWLESLGHSVEPLEHGCQVGGLVGEFQYQRFPVLRPWLERPRMKGQDFFVVANREITKCFLVRSDATFRKGPLHWEFDESEAAKIAMPQEFGKSP